MGPRINRLPDRTAFKVALYVFAYDRNASTLVGAKVGDPCTDEDYERIVESTNRLVREAPPGALVRFVLVIDPGQPPPSAVWRKRLADARTESQFFRFAMVSDSIVERGTITAIQWLKPLSPGQKVISCATFEEAVAWFEAESGPLPILHALYARVRAQPARAGVARTHSEAKIGSATGPKP